MLWLLDSAGRADPGGGRLAVRRAPATCSARRSSMSGVVPQVAALMGPCAAGTAYIPGLADFVPMVKGRGSMALAGPHLTKAVTGEDVTQEELGGSRIHTPHLGRGRPRGGVRRGLHRRRSRTTSRYFPQHCEEPPPLREPADPVDRDGRGAARHPARLAAQAVRHVRRDRADRGRRRVVRPEAALGAHDHHLPGADGRPAGGDRGQPAEAPRRHPRERLRRQGGAVREPVRRVRHPAAVPDGRARLHGGHEGRAGRDHPARREDALRGVARDGAEDHGGDPQGLRRRLLRDERPRLRARPDRGVAERGDLA